LTVQSLRCDELTSDRSARWAELFGQQPGVANPFCSPVWVTHWLRHYVPRQDQRILWVGDGAELVGVAPLYVQRIRVAGMPVAVRLTMAGSGRTTPLELPELLSAPGHERAVVRAVIQHSLTEDVAWCEISLGRRHGWFPPATSGTPGWVPVTFQRHQRARACVVLELADSWAMTRAGLKRNVKESLRRARNRLARDGRPWAVRHRHGADLDVAAVDRLMRLHAVRSAFGGSWARHTDAYADPAHRQLMRAVLPLLGAARQASIAELELGGRVVAAQLVLHAPGTLYFHSSGFEPDVWQLSPVTALQEAAIQAGIDDGARWVNFSPGPNEAKSRWSDGLHVVDDFAYGAGGRPDLARYTAFTLAQEVRMLRLTHHEAQREAGAHAG
jgi:CelD/BcsL family acetyltransferase involved in cellulose biosynthesis